MPPLFRVEEDPLTDVCRLSEEGTWPSGRPWTVEAEFASKCPVELGFTSEADADRRERKEARKERWMVLDLIQLHWPSISPSALCWHIDLARFEDRE